MKHIETQWDNFRRIVIPGDATPPQLRAMKRSFFAGAWAYYTLIMRLFGEGGDVTPADLTLMAKLHDEMVEFRERVVRGEQ